MNILDPRFKYIPASTHSTSEAFQARQLARLKEAQCPPKSSPSPVSTAQSGA